MSFLSTDKKSPSPLAYHRILSPSAAVKVSPICLGTMNFGGSWKELMGECDKTTTFEILDFFYASGGNFIDTANMYMLGESECWLGEWMADRNVRDQMIVGTKYSISTRDLNTDPEGSILSNYAGNSKKSLRLSLDQSLKNLQTDYVDILYVHAWEGLCSIEELMRALDDLVRAGKVLYLGVSNWPAWVVVKANAYARQHGLTTFVVYQGRWNPADRDIERDVIPMCKHEGIGITAWGALGGGKFKRANSKDSDGRHFTDDLGGASLETFQKCGHVMDKIGKTKGCDAIAVALRYVMLKEPYVFPVIGGRKVNHLKANIQALNIDLSDEEIASIESVAPFNIGYPHSLLSGSSTENISPSNPAFFVKRAGYFDGVLESKAIRSYH